MKIIQDIEIQHAVFIKMKKDSIQRKISDMSGHTSSFNFVSRKSKFEARAVCVPLAAIQRQQTVEERFTR